jgi:hypothetical protein
MPVIYEDQVGEPCLGCNCAGTKQCEYCGVDGVGINLPNLIKGALNAVGLRDPLNQYEPGVPEGTVFAKYSAMISAYQGRVPMLRSDTARKSLAKSVATLASTRDSLARVYATAGAAGGTKDRDRLASLVQDTRDFRRQLWAAEKQYGTNAPPAATEEAMAAAGGGKSLLPILGIAALALLGLGFSSKR